MKVLLNHEGNLGYGPDQVQGMTLGDLLAAVEEAVTEWGEDAEVVLQQTNNRYGACFGHLNRWDTFAYPDADEDEEVSL
jgi:hypothetical protein